MSGDWKQGLLYEQSRLPRVKVNTDKYVLGKTMFIWLEYLKKKKEKSHYHPKKPPLKKKAKNTNQPSSHKKLSPTQNTPKNQTVLQFISFPKQIQEERAALVNQLPLWTLKQSFYRCKKQYLTIYSFPFQQHWVHNVKMKDLSLVLWNSKSPTHKTVFLFYFYTKTTHTKSRCSKLTL